MRILLQRVLEASVEVEHETVSAIGPGLLLLVGFTSGDGPSELTWMAKKCTSLRVFSDTEGKMNRSVLDEQGEVLVVSQFTLYGNPLKGNRPSFVEAAAPDAAERLYERFIAELEKILGTPPGTGRFGADMKVRLINDGPVTLWLDRAPTERGEGA